MIGTTRDDDSLGIWAILGADPYSWEYLPFLAGEFGVYYAWEVSTLYPLANYPSTFQAMTAASGDFNVHCPSRRLARRWAELGADAYLYMFSYSPPSNLYNISANLGAYHGSGLPFVFHHELPNNSNDNNNHNIKGEELLSQQMMTYWANFASTHNPNPNPQHNIHNDLPVWPKYDAKLDQNINFDIPTTTVQDHLGSSGSLCDKFWDRTQIGSFPAVCLSLY